MLVATLSPEGFPVTTFEDANSFLKAAKTRVPLCVFLDVVMPQRSGLEILDELRVQKIVRHRLINCFQCYWTVRTSLAGMGLRHSRSSHGGGKALHRIGEAGNDAH